MKEPTQSAPANLWATAPIELDREGESRQGQHMTDLNRNRSRHRLRLAQARASSKCVSDEPHRQSNQFGLGRRTHHGRTIVGMCACCSRVVGKVPKLGENSKDRFIVFVSELLNQECSQAKAHVGILSSVLAGFPRRIRVTLHYRVFFRRFFQSSLGSPSDEQLKFRLELTEPSPHLLGTESTPMEKGTHRDSLGLSHS